MNNFEAAKKQINRSDFIKATNSIVKKIHKN